MRRTSSGVIATVLLLTALAVPASADTAISDTAFVSKDGEEATAADVALAMSEQTFTAAPTVVVARDDSFADALASGMLQADGSLMLVPSDGPVPDGVIAEIERLGARTATILGGPVAVAEAVEQQLQDEGLAVARRAGASRLETAVDIAANDAPDADHAIIARAFPSPGAGDSQAFADTLAAGGLAAERRWPILLTQTDALSEPTRQYLESAAIGAVTIVGGPAAVGDAVEAELRDMGLDVERLQGQTRAGTAVAVAESRSGASGASFAGVSTGGRAVLVDGFADDAWVGGFSAAAYSAVNDAPIVLAAGQTLPPETEAWLDGRAAGPELPRTSLACVVEIDVCQQARVTMGLPEAAQIQIQPGDGGSVAPGEEVVVGIEVAEPLDGPVTVGGSCLETITQHAPASEIIVQAASTLPPGACTITVTVHFASGSAQTVGATLNGSLPDASTHALLFIERMGERTREPGEGIWRMNPDGSDRTLVFACDCTAVRPSPDGQFIVALRQDTDDFQVIRLAAPGFDRPTVLHSGDEARGSLHVSLEGTRAVFGVSDTWGVNMDGSGARRLHPDYQLRADGQVIAPSGPGGASEVLVFRNAGGVTFNGLLNLDSGAVREVPLDFQPAAVSPDGSYLAGRLDASEDCWALLDLQTSTSACITDGEGGNPQARAFTADGRNFLVRSGNDGLLGDTATASVDLDQEPLLEGTFNISGTITPARDLRAFAARRSSEIVLVTRPPAIRRTIAPGEGMAFPDLAWIFAPG